MIFSPKQVFFSWLLPYLVVVHERRDDPGGGELASRVGGGAGGADAVGVVGGLRGI